MANAPPGPGVTNPLATIEQRWNRAMKVLHVGPKSPSLSLADVTTTSHAWSLATRHLYLRHLDDTSPRLEIPKSTLLAVYATLKTAKLMHNLLNWFLGMMYNKRHMIIDDVSPRIKEWERTRDASRAYDLIIRLYHWKIEWYRETGAFTHHGVDSYWPFKRTFRTIILSFLPPSFADTLQAVLKKTFSEAAQSESRLAIANALDQMGILIDFKTLINLAIDQEIERHVMETCPRIRDQHMLPELRTWFNDRVKTWMTDIFGKERPDAAYRKFEHYMLKVLCDLRISELFEIIVDYEDKTHPLPVLQDLKDCLARTGQRKELVKGLRESTIKRLLQPGAATSDILQQYVSTIKVLRFLDPPGVLLYGVAEPIRQYLRERPDTIKIIVANLIPRKKKKKDKDAMDEDDDGSDDEDKDEGVLLDDQNEPAPIQANEEIYEDYTDPAWQPPANDAEPGFRAQKTSDIISTLVSIFGSKDLFIKELQISFGQRLLAITDGNYDEEVHNLEVLKIRFGDTPLQICDVMMKDLTDSRRTDQHIQDRIQSALHSTIISRHFWPSMPRSTLQLPGQLRELQKIYENEYQVQKQDKKLKWLPHMGTVELTVQMDDGREIRVTATPLQAAVIELFSDSPQWHVEQLAERLGKLDITSVALALMFWQSQGVVQDLGAHLFRLRETLDQNAQNTESTPAATEYGLGVAAESPEEHGSVEVYWSFVRAMLTNLGQLPTERIHGMLRLAPGPNPTPEQTLHFLESAQREGLVEFRDHLWSLPRR